MQQFGQMPIDPNSVNLNTAGSTNGAMFPPEMGQANFNMNGVYNMYSGQNGNLNN